MVMKQHKAGGSCIKENIIKYGYCSPPGPQDWVERPRAAHRGQASGCMLSNPPVPLKIDRTADKRPNLAQDFKPQERCKIFRRKFTQEKRIIRV